MNLATLILALFIVVANLTEKPPKPRFESDDDCLYLNPTEKVPCQLVMTRIGE